MGARLQGGFKGLLLVATVAGMPVAALAQNAGDEEVTRTVLDPVVVTATTTEQSSLTAPAFTTVVTAQDIERAGPSNGLPDILRRSVGIDNNTDSLGRDELVVRGLGGEYTLVLVNGKRVSSSNALWRGGDFDLHSVPLSAIERVEVLRGPMSSLYGADAMGGVVNIITKTPTDEWTGSVGAEYRLPVSGDDGNQYRGNFYTTGPLVDGVSASVSGEFYNRDAWMHDSKDDGAVPALEEKRLANLFSTIDWDVTDQQTVGLHYGLNRDERPYQIFNTTPSYRDQTITRNTVGASHTGRWDWGTTTLEANYEHAGIDDFNTQYDDPQQRELTEETVSLLGRTNFQIGVNSLTAGLEYRNQVVKDEASYADSGQVEIGQTAVFLQDEIGLTDDLKLTLGTRYDDHEIYGGELTSRANVVYTVTDGVALKAGIGQAFKAPDAYQLSESYEIVSCGGRCTLAGNPDLEPETSVTAEVGVEVRQKRWDASVAVFKTKVEDMIVATYDPATVSRAWENVDEVEIYGLELAGSVDITREVYASANYAYLYTEDGNGEQLDNRPYHKANASLTWQFLDELGTTVSASFTGSQLQSGSRVPGYATVDWGVTADVTDTMTLGAGVQNITNVILSEEDADFESHQLGRTVYVNAVYRF